VGIVVNDLDVLETIVEEGRGTATKTDTRQGSGLPGELDVHNVICQMVPVEVKVAEAVHKLPDTQVALLGEHVGEERIARDIERDAQEQVRAALIELAGEPSFDNIELE
jgi:hypothetical protein